MSYQINGSDDPLNRIQTRYYDLSGPLESGLTINVASGVTYSYMTTGDKSRISQIRTDGFLTENYSYDVESRVIEYKQTVDFRASYPMTVNYLYDSLDRIKEVTYPAQYGPNGGVRKIVANSYDTASRLTSMTYGTATTPVQQAGNIVYNASDQTTSIKIGTAGTNQVTENYTFDQQTGLLTNQKAIRNVGTKSQTTLLDLSYDYNRGQSVGTLNGKTGHLTKITDNLNNNKNREYEFDAVGRLTKMKGGVNGALSQQTYTYDRFGNRTNVTATGVAANNTTMPMDGIPNLAFNAASNRITTSGFQYDSAGNQTRALAEDGVTWVKYEYDAANRIQLVKRDDGTLLQAFQYGSTNARLMDYDALAGLNKLFASVGGTTLAEYTEFAATVMTWTKSYTYLGDSQLATVTPNGSGGEFTEYNHPDRLGTRVITNQTLGTSYEQNTLPFGTALNAESSVTNNNKRFTSYDRSAPTGLDYAINRTYDSKQGRFTQVDPIGMRSVSLTAPQTLNLYTYCGNDPINHTDPDGLFWGAIGRFFKKIFKWLAVAVSVAIAVLTIVFAPYLFATTLKLILGIVAAVANAASSVLSALGFAKAAAVFGIISGFASFGTSFLNARSALNWKTFFSAVSSAATAMSRTLSYLGHTKLGQIFGLISSTTGFISDGLTATPIKDGNGKTIGWNYGWNSSRLKWRIYKFARSTAEQVANLVGATRVAGFLNVFGIIDDVGDSILGIKDFFKNNVAGGDKVEKLDFWNNTTRVLSGSEEFNARFSILFVNVLRRSNAQVGRINSIMRRIDRGIALAH